MNDMKTTVPGQKETTGKTCTIATVMQFCLQTVHK